MLMLSRRELETIVIFTGADEQIVIIVDRIGNGQVKLSFDAPRTADIWRGEVLESGPVEESVSEQ